MGPVEMLLGGLPNHQINPKKTDINEQETAHEGVPDQGHPRARVRPEPGRDLQGAEHHGADVLPLEDAARDDDEPGRPAPEGAREGEQGAQADAGRRAAAGAHPQDKGSLRGNNAQILNPDPHAHDKDFNYERYETTPEDETALQKWIEDNYNRGETT